MPIWKPLVAVCALALATHASAQKINPGLWEYSFSVKGAGGQMEGSMAQMQQQMQQQLAAMPPERRKQMEEMMASRGVGMGSMGGAGGAMAVRFCLTPEQAAREDMPQKDSQCKQLSRQRSGNVVHVKFACSGDPPSTGEGEYTLVSDKEMKGHMTVNTQINGKPQQIESDQTGRWLGADCGNVKPRP